MQDPVCFEESKRRSKKEERGEGVCVCVCVWTGNKNQKVRERNGRNSTSESEVKQKGGRGRDTEESARLLSRRRENKHGNAKDRKAKSTAATISCGTQHHRKPNSTTSSNFSEDTKHTHHHIENTTAATDPSNKCNKPSLIHQKETCWLQGKLRRDGSLSQLTKRFIYNR